MIPARKRHFFLVAALFLLLLFCPLANGNEEAVCEIAVQTGPNSRTKGSGALISRERGKSYILTCSHLFTDGASDILVRFNSLSLPFSAGVVGQHDSRDLALCVVDGDVPITPAEIDGRKPLGELRISGFGTRGIIRHLPSRYLRDAGGHTVVLGAARQGDSGGPILGPKNKLRGVLWGQADGMTYCTAGVALAQFCNRFGVCPGACRPRRLLEPPILPRLIVPNRRLFEPPIIPRPQRPPKTILPDPTQDYQGQLDALSERLTALESMPLPEPLAGPPGPAGERGPRGYRGEQGIAGEQSVRQESAEAAHYVLVRDESAGYWTRMADRLRRAQGSYSQIRVSSPPDFPVGLMPQLVAYRGGKPLGAFRGERAVNEALASLDEGVVPAL